jgi:hypothetical protein
LEFLGHLEFSVVFPFLVRGVLAYKRILAGRSTGKEGWEARIVAGSKGLALSEEDMGSGLEFRIGFNVYIPGAQKGSRTKSRG